MNPYSILSQGGVNVPTSADWRTGTGYGAPEISFDDMVTRSTFLSISAIDKFVRRFSNRPSHA